MWKYFPNWLNSSIYIFSVISIAECLDSLVAEQDSSKCLEDKGQGLKHDNDCIDCMKPPKQGCADGYLMNSYEHQNPTYGTCSKITCTQVPGHNPSKCLEDKGQGLKPDNDCVDCMKPPKQGCADGYLMNSYQHSHPTYGTCSKITCTVPCQWMETR